jgi:uncharacterized protein (DUF1330 family)
LHSLVANQPRSIVIIFTSSVPPTRKSIARSVWVSPYRAVNDPDKLAAYAKLAGPTLVVNGARFLARGVPAKIYEFGLLEHTVLIEFDSVEQAIAAHDSPAYQEALAALGNGADREIRIIEGV